MSQFQTTQDDRARNRSYGWYTFIVVAVLLAISSALLYHGFSILEQGEITSASAVVLNTCPSVVWQAPH